MSITQDQATRNGAYPALSQAHRVHLVEGSAIAPEIVQERPYFTVESKHQWQQIDQKLSEKQIRTPGIGYPAYRVARPEPYVHVLRPDKPRILSNKPVKYEWPKGIPPCLDILPRFTEALPDPSIDLWFTEGAKKADSLASHNPNIVTVNLNGVWGIRGINTYGGKATLTDFRDIALNGRRIVIAYDNDVIRKPEVLRAVDELTALLLARGVRDVLVLALPQFEDEKLGVDDAFAQGYSFDQLCGYLLPLAEVHGMVRQKLFAHHETGKTLFLPAGYLNTGEKIARVDRRGEPYIVYPGMLAVYASGVDLRTNVETLTVRFDGREQKPTEVTAPRADLAQKKGVIEHLAAQGAAVHESNAKDVAQYLSEFAHENRDALPHRYHTDKLGLVGAGVVLPAGSVGFNEPVRYTGKRRIHVGTDHDLYKQTLANILTWQNTWPLWLAFSLSLASPVIARKQLRRNPALYLGGSSNSGKTTTAQFAVGVWGDPTQSPFRLEGSRSTRAGVLQSLEELGGLPLFIDEAHTASDPRNLEAIVYQFANGETYTKGGIDGKARGGEPLGGALLCAGEALPEFKHAGAKNRMIWVDVMRYPPLGCAPNTNEGAQRAEVLERAWVHGAGTLGLEVTRMLWSDWASVTERMHELQTHQALKDLHAWHAPLLIASVVLGLTFEMLDLDTPETFKGLLDQWRDMLKSGQDQSDPATEAWERLVMMLVQASISDEHMPGWEVASVDHGTVAYRKVGETFWRIPTATPQFKERIGANAVQLYGQTWVQRGWIVPDAKKQTATQLMRAARGEVVRVLCIERDVFETWS